VRQITPGDCQGGDCEGAAGDGAGDTDHRQRIAEEAADELARDDF
jgi:hypothetical protein